MVKRKRDNDHSGVPFHRDFVEPTDQNRKAALGDFPSKFPRPESLWQCFPCQAPNDLDDESLYQTTNIKIPRPSFELDWLAQVPKRVKVCRNTSPF